MVKTSLKHLFVAVFLGCTSTGFMVLWFYVQELPKAQPAVVLVCLAKIHMKFIKISLQINDKVANLNESLQYRVRALF